MLYKGQTQRFATFVASDLPTAAAKLYKIVAALEAYVMLQAQEASPQAPRAQPTGEVARDVGPAEPPPPVNEPPKES